MPKLSDERILMIRSVLRLLHSDLRDDLTLLLNEVEEGRKVVEIHFDPDQRIYVCPHCDTVAPWCAARRDMSDPDHRVMMDEGDRYCSHCGVQLVWKE